MIAVPSTAALRARNDELGSSCRELGLSVFATFDQFHKTDGRQPRVHIGNTRTSLIERFRAGSRRSLRSAPHTYLASRFLMPHSDEA